MTKEDKHRAYMRAYRANQRKNPQTMLCDCGRRAVVVFCGDAICAVCSEIQSRYYKVVGNGK